MKKGHRQIAGYKKVLVTAATILSITTALYPATYIYAAEQAGSAITIEKPDGWKQGDANVTVSVDTSQMGEGFQIAKIEAKVGKDGSWQDITESKSVTIKGNETVYVRVTDQNGTVYEQNRSIRCYDTEKPTLSASLTDGILTIQGNDSVSGISAITVNGTTYTELQDGKLKIQLTQKDFTTKQIEITVTDGAGNISDKLSEKESSPSEIDTQNLPGMMNQWVPDALADYGLWGLAMGTGFLAGLVFVWFAGYGVVTLIVVILVILLTAAAGIVYFKCKK